MSRSEQILELLADAGPDGLLVADIADRIIFLLALGVLLWVCWQGWHGGLA